MENDFRILNVQIVNDICYISDLLCPSLGSGHIGKVSNRIRQHCSDSSIWNGEFIFVAINYTSSN